MTLAVSYATIRSGIGTVREGRNRSRSASFDEVVVKRFARLITNGKDLSDSTARRLEKGLERDADDLESRLLLIGYWGRVRFPVHADSWKARREEHRRHVCWLIEHHPGIDLTYVWNGAPFMVDAGIAAQWREAARRHADDDDVAWNAAKASFLIEPTSAITLCQRAKLRAPQRASEILKLCSSHVSLGRASDATVAQMVGTCGVSNGLEAFELEESDDARFMMLWPMRECARLAGDEALLALFRAADREGNLRRAHAADASDATHHACTGRGLVALARGDLAAAESWLLRASEIADLPHAPSTALADAMGAARRGDAGRGEKTGHAR
jgi:hypothetical protein